MAGKLKEEARREDVNDNDSSAGKNFFSREKQMKCVSFIQWNNVIIKMLRETFNEFHAGR